MFEKVRVMKIHKNDTVKIMAGKDKGKTGKVIKVLPTENKIVVEGVNIAKRHVKPNANSKEGGIVSIERPLNASNAMVYDASKKAAFRVGYKVIEGKKYRINKKTGEALEKN